jgi:hypothetical protein
MAIPIPSYETVASWICGLLPKLKRFWNDLNGPRISAELLYLKPSTSRLEVKNCGGGTVFVKAFLHKVTDREGNESGEVTSEIELYASQTLEPVRLHGKARSLYSFYVCSPGVLLFSTTTHVSLIDGEKKSAGIVSIRIPESSDSQGETRFQFRVVFYSSQESQEELMDELVEYSISALPNGEGYTIRQIKRRHKSIFDN